MSKTKRLTQEEITALFCAANERNITEKSLSEEIQPLIEEYFHGETEMKDDCILIKFLNGQSFKLTVTAA